MNNTDSDNSDNNNNSTTTTARKNNQNKKKFQKQDQRPRGGRNNNKSGPKNSRSSQQNSHPAWSEKKNRQQQNIEVLSTNFMSSIHYKCRAGQYKVHAPGCSCPKVQHLRERQKSQHHTTSPHDGSEEKGNWVEPNSPPPSLDGLLMIPEIKFVSSIYLCSETGRDMFEKTNNGTGFLAAEAKLAKELFATPPIEPPPSGHVPKLKVNCAQCLLQIQPNGFVCISSTSKADVLHARELALCASSEKVRNGIPLHADHAENVAVVSRSVLESVAIAKTKADTKHAMKNLTAELRDQGISSTTVGNNNEISNGKVDYKLGHHIRALLRICKSHEKKKTSPLVLQHMDYWFVIIQNATEKKDCKNKMIDLPGGKRHLGETSFEGAVRETLEEASLSVNSEWLIANTNKDEVGNNKENFFAEMGNIYYLMKPPPSITSRNKDGTTTTEAENNNNDNHNKEMEHVIEQTSILSLIPSSLF